MLDDYLLKTRNLLQNPTAPTALYSDLNLTSYINTARGQLAGEAKCIRKIGTLTTTVDQRPYDFSDINLGVVATTGVEGAINVRRVAYSIGDDGGQRWIPPKAWEWFELYELNNPVPTSSYPKVWSQYAQGAAPGDTGSGGGGSLYISPPPDTTYTLYCDCECYPQILEDDTDVEAIPYLFTDAVPFFAAYLALLSSQVQARVADAERYYNMYLTFVERARRAANPDVGTWQYEQASDPAQAIKMTYNRPGGPLLPGGGS